MADLITTTRIKVEDLRDIFETTLTDDQLNAFINMASRLVDANLVGEGLSDEILFDIELLLSAHFSALRDPRMQSENIAGEWSFKVQGETKMQLDSTFYGQQAKLLDTTGTLDRIGANLKKARITVLEDVE